MSLCVRRSSPVSRPRANSGCTPGSPTRWSGSIPGPSTNAQETSWTISAKRDRSLTPGNWPTISYGHNKHAASRVAVQQPPQPCTALHGAGILACVAGRRHKQDIALVIALPMVMAHLCVEPIPQGVFAAQYPHRQRCLCDRSDPVLRAERQSISLLRLLPRLLAPLARLAADHLLRAPLHTPPGTPRHADDAGAV